MRYAKRSFALVCLLFAVPTSLSMGSVSENDAYLGPRTLVAAQSVKQQCVDTCRARYRDCRRLNQLPSFECRSVYQDCTRYSCSGLGPG